MTLSAARTLRSCLISARAKAAQMCDMREVHRIDGLLRKATTTVLRLEMKR